jgi:hypothetical protein
MDNGHAKGGLKEMMGHGDKMAWKGGDWAEERISPLEKMFPREKVGLGK